MTTLKKFQQSELKRFDDEFPCESEMCLTGCICGNKEIKSFLNSTIEKAYKLGEKKVWDMLKERRKYKFNKI